MFLVVNGLKIRPVTVRKQGAGLITVAFTDVDKPACTRVHPSRLYRTEEEARAALAAYRAKAAPAAPQRSGEMEWRWLMDHSGSPDP